MLFIDQKYKVYLIANKKNYVFRRLFFFLYKIPLLFK